MPTDNRIALAHVREARDRAIALLQDHFAHDSFDVDELERRVTAAHTSESVAQLEALVADLPPLGGAAAPATPVMNALVPAGQVHEVATVRGIMSATQRGGNWDVPRRLEVRGLMSATVLDFREARFPAGPVDIDVRAVMSSVEIIVPPGLAVATDGSAIMGTFEQVHRAPAHPDPDAPLLRIHGRVIMGTVEVKLRLPGERGQLDAKLSAQAERRALRDDRARMKHEQHMLKEQRRVLKEQRRLEARRED